MGRARPYVVQYNESDFDFLSRLLEDEGLSYTFEHGRSEVVLCITDGPGVAPLFDASETFPLQRRSITGTAQEQEVVRSFRDTRRLRSRAVTVRDWDYFRSTAPLEAKAEDSTTDPDLSRHFEFPVGEEAIPQNPGEHAATVRKQRYDVERALREGMCNVRIMEPGRRFTLHDTDGILEDMQLLAVRVETFATELTPQRTLLDEEPFGFANAVGPPSQGFDSRFLALPQSLPFRPAMRTPKPRIHGVQAAVVTAEEYPQGDRPVINGDSIGRVRVRFPWDQRPDTGDQTPTSRWIRVSQFWAGTGYGAIYTPRVGHEVLVAYMQGDPDQPVIVGRVYNLQHVPPYDTRKEPTKSTLKSQSAEEKKEVDGFNELRFDDRAKKEEIYLHAQRNLNEVVLANHSTGVGGNQSNGVGGDQSNTVQGHRDHTIGDYENVTVGGDRTTLFKANEHHTVVGFRDVSVGANETHTVGGFRATKIGANDDHHIDGWHNVTVGIGDTLDVKANRDVTVHADYNVRTSGNYMSEAGCKISVKAPLILVNGTVITSVHGGVSLYLYGGSGAHLNAGGHVDIGAPLVDIEGSGIVHVHGGTVNVDGGTVNIEGSTVNIKGGPINLNC